MRPKVLVLTSTYPRWPEDHEPRFVHELSLRLTSKFEVHVLAPHAPGVKRSEIMDGVHVHRFHYAPEGFESLAYEGGILSRIRERRIRLLLVPLFLLAQVLAVRRLLKTYSFSAIHAHWIIPQCLTGLVALMGNKSRIPMVCTSHGADLFGLHGKVTTALKAWVLRHCAAVTVVSNAMANEVKRITPDTVIQVIPMGTDFESRFTPRPSVDRDYDQLLFVGRLVEKKGVANLLHAFAALQAQRPSLRLDIAGYGQEEGRLRKLCASLEIEQSVRFLGAVHQDHLPDLYRRAGVTIVPSVVAADGDQEGFGLVIVEAIGCGSPVVASDLPAIRHSAGLEGGIRLVPPGDQGALEKAIATVLDQHGDALLAANATRKRLRKCFGWKNTAHSYCGLLGTVITNTP